LVSSVAVKQWMGIRISRDSFTKCVKNQRIIIAVADNKGYDTSVIQIKDGTEIDLMDNQPFVPFKLSNIRQPLFIWPVRLEFPVQLVFSNILRISSMASAAIV